MKVLLLAAGFATRLYPLTRDRAKPLLDIAGRPVLSRLLQDSVLPIPGLSEVVVVSNHRFHAQFVDWSRSLGRDLPVHVLDDGATSDEDKKGGVADLGLAWDDAASRGEEEVVVLAGDNLLEFSLQAPAADFAAHGQPAMLVRHFPEGAPPGRFGEVSVDEDFVITRFREKPAVPESPYAATCMYFFPAAIRARLHEYLASGADPDAPGNFIAWLSQRVPVRAIPMPGRAHDIGNLETLEAARAAYEGR